MILSRFLRPRSMPLAVALASLSLVAGSRPKSAELAPPSSGAMPIPYPHKAVKKQEFGSGPKSYWLFEPADPRPEHAPVVVFHHGWLAVNPGAYGAWIEHLVRSGRIVVFPRYQADWTTPTTEFLPNALAAVRDALDVLQTSRHYVRPELDHFILIGHSAGGNLAAQMAAIAAKSGLPEPKALIALMPGEVLPCREPSLADIPAHTLLVVVAAEHDLVVGDRRARQIYAETTAIPPSRKKYVLYRTDRHGSPNLVAHHFAPTAALSWFDTGEGPLRSLQMTGAEINVFDSQGFWRLADLTIEAAFAGQTLDEATGNGALFRDLGSWSDGRAVLAPIVGDDLSVIPRVFPANGLRLLPWPAVAAPQSSGDEAIPPSPAPMPH